jgi:sulfur carrier protein
MDVVVVTTALAWLPASTVVGSAPMSSSIDVLINGKARTLPEGTSILALLGELGLGDQRVAVERNREVVPRAQHATTLLVEGDRVELVTFVGGG